jgi:hypothetical protein
VREAICRNFSDDFVALEYLRLWVSSKQEFLKTPTKARAAAASGAVVQKSFSARRPIRRNAFARGFSRASKKGWIIDNVAS